MWKTGPVSHLLLLAVAEESQKFWEQIHGRDEPGARADTARWICWTSYSFTNLSRKQK